MNQWIQRGRSRGGHKLIGLLFACYAVALFHFGFVFEVLAAYPVICLVGWAYLQLSDQYSYRKRKDLFDEEALAGVWDYPHNAVYVQVHARKAIIGEDRGVLWQEDGLLFYVGDAMSFTLSANEIAVEQRNDRPSWRVIDSKLNLQAPGFPKGVYITFEEVQWMENTVFPHVDKIKALREVRDLCAGDERVLMPPVSLGPGSYTVWRYVEEILLLVGLGLALCVLFLYLEVVALVILFPSTIWDIDISPITLLFCLNLLILIKPLGIWDRLSAIITIWKLESQVPR